VKIGGLVRFVGLWKKKNLKKKATKPYNSDQCRAVPRQLEKFKDNADAIDSAKSFITGDCMSVGRGV
jgi:hypothetical protein